MKIIQSLSTLLSFICIFGLHGIWGCNGKENKDKQENELTSSFSTTEESDIRKKITVLKDSLSQTPSNIDLLNEIAYSYASINDRMALAYADTLILIKHMDNAVAWGHFNKGIYYSNTGITDSAMIEYGAAIDADYKMIDAYIEKAILLYDQKDFTASFSLLEKATAVNQYISSLYFWMAKNKQALGSKNEAIFYYRQCLELKPSAEESKEAKEMIQKLEK